MTNEMHKGYVKIWRKMLDNAIAKNPKLLAFWIHCLMKASHKKFNMMVGYESVQLLPGQFIFGRKKFAEETGLSEQSIRTCTKTLKNLGNLTIMPTSRYTLITIVNWAKYQVNGEASTSEVTIKQPAANQPLTTNKNAKNIKKGGRPRKFISELKIQQKEILDRLSFLDKKNPAHKAERKELRDKLDDISKSIRSA